VTNHAIGLSARSNLEYTLDEIFKNADQKIQVIYKMPINGKIQE